VVRNFRIEAEKSGSEKGVGCLKHGKTLIECPGIVELPDESFTEMAHFAIPTRVNMTSKPFNLHGSLHNFSPQS